MKTVKEVSRLSGVSVRTLHYYDEKGLLKPTETTEAGYRLYDDEAIERLQTIMMFRELEFSLKEIKTMMDSPDFDRERALKQQIEMLHMKKKRIDDLITFAQAIKITGGRNMDFSAFDKSEMDEYAVQAKKIWGKTEAYKEYEVKSAGRSEKQHADISDGLIALFAELGGMKSQEPGSEEVQKQIGRIQSYITENYYKCTDEIFAGLGKMYGGGGSMTENIDKAGGAGTGKFAEKAIEIYCSR